MKKLNIYHAIAAPVIALFAVGCSSPVAMQSTEYDDMYYSSSDRTEYVQPQAQAPQQQQYAPAQGEQQAAGDITENYNADEYYDGRTYRPQATWNTPNYAYVDPYWTTAYVHRMNRFNAFYDPFFYDPFFDPFMARGFHDPFWGRSGLSVNIGIGMGMGWGHGWNRWGHPYAMGMYDPFWGRGGWWPHNNYYAGFYHGYNQGMWGGNRFIYDTPFVGQRRQVQYGPRGERSVTPLTGSPERVVGRPSRTESVRNEQQSTQQNVDYARPTRTERSPGNTNVRSQEMNAEGGRQNLPARPATTNRGYDPQSGQVRPARQQPEGQQPVQRMRPANEGNVSPAQRPVERQQRIEQPQPTQRQERVQPVQRQQRMQQQPVQRSQPNYQRSQPVQRSQPNIQRSQPVQRSQPSYSPPTRSSGTSSPPVRSNSGGGGRPGRGGN